MSFKNKHKYQWKDLQGRDFLLPFIYWIGNFCLSIVILTIMIAMNETQEKGTSSFNVNITGTSSLVMEIISFIIIVGLWILFHRHSFKTSWIQGLQNIKQHWKLITITFIAMLVFKEIYPYFVDAFAPEQWKFKETQNDKIVEGMFATPVSTILAFFSIVIIAPMTEEFLFRHLIIGELGKKLNFYVMSVISIIVFASLHVTEAKSPLEIVMYLVIAVGIVYVYLKSNRSLAVAIALHTLNNLVAYIFMVIM
ncbi:CPBP family intramembrane metalloprotease [Staphylococcus sp. GSSP0090]|nr:CPBP family intramembrane metalloprotease [Staphylococcus sp. GSSP0090]